MLSSEDNDLLTRTGPETPGGEFFRRYWQPAALSEELPAGGAPLPTRLLGEDLVLFRDDRGRLGLLGLHCAHRAADLSYGRIEDGGLRCLYHGWLYDVHGRCLEQPAEPPDSRFHEKVRHLSYPCQEAGGIIYAYMGSAEPPLLPAYPFMEAPEECRWVSKILHECNYLQGNEGNLDPRHLTFLHRTFGEGMEHQVAAVPPGGDVPINDLLDQIPSLEMEETDFGARVYTVRVLNSGRQYVRVSNFIYPNGSAFSGGSGADGLGYGMHWHIPIDDTHHWKYVVFFTQSPMDKSEIEGAWAQEMATGYRPIRNLENRYLQDREEMKTRTFTGMGNVFQVHDHWVTVGQGPIGDRTGEHLATSDKIITATRKLLLQAIRQVQEGADPPHVVRDPAANRFPHLGACEEVISTTEEWSSVWKRRLALLAGEPTSA